MSANKPNWFLNFFCFAVSILGTLASFGFLVLPIFFIAGPVFMFAKSGLTKSAAASALVGILVVLVGSLIPSYFHLLR